MSKSIETRRTLHLLFVRFFFFHFGKNAADAFFASKDRRFFSAPFVTPGSYLLPLELVHCLGCCLHFKFFFCFAISAISGRFFCFRCFLGDRARASVFFTQENVNHYCAFIFVDAAASIENPPFRPPWTIETQ